MVLIYKREGVFRQLLVIKLTEGLKINGRSYSLRPGIIKTSERLIVRVGLQV